MWQREPGSSQETRGRGRTINQYSCPCSQEEVQLGFWGLQLLVAAAHTESRNSGRNTGLGLGGVHSTELSTLEAASQPVIQSSSCLLPSHSFLAQPPCPLCTKGLAPSQARLGDAWPNEEICVSTLASLALLSSPQGKLNTLACITHLDLVRNTFSGPDLTLSF